MAKCLSIFHSLHRIGMEAVCFVTQGLSGLQDAPRSGQPRIFSPEDRIAVVAIASEKTEEHDCPATRWSLSDLAATIINEAAAEKMSQSTIWRVLNDADLKPHKSVYWLNSHDPKCDAKAKEICGLYVKAPVLMQRGELLICTDEKTGMQILERKHPTQLARPGHPEKREHEYIRHGTRAQSIKYAGIPSPTVVTCQAWSEGAQIGENG